MSESLLFDGLFDFSSEQFDAQTPLQTLLLQKAAQVSCETNLHKAHALYRAVLERLVVLERAGRFSPSSTTPDFLAEQEQKFKAFLSENAGVCSIAVQPFFPAGTVFELSDLRTKAGALRRVDFATERFLSSYESTVLGGLLFLDERYSTGSRDSQQIQTNGLVYDVCSCVRDHEERRVAFLSIVVERVIVVLRAARSLFQESGLEEDVRVSVGLDGVGECSIPHLLVQSINHSSIHDYPLSLFSSYRWQKRLPATTWKDEGELQQFALDFLQEICWGLGQEQTQRAHVERFLRQVSLFLE